MPGSEEAWSLPALADLVGVLQDGGPAAVVEWWDEMDPPCPAWVAGIEQVEHPDHELGEVLVVRCPDGSFAVDIWDDFRLASQGQEVGRPGEDIAVVVERACPASEWVF